MNEEIKYYENIPARLDAVKMEILEILNVLHDSNAILNKGYDNYTAVLGVLLKDIFQFSNMHLMKLYGRQDDGIPSAPTFTAGDQ